MIRMVKKWENNHNVRMCVHDGIFHADDVLCVALVDTFLDRDIEVIRTRNTDIMAEADICCDIKSPLGNLYIPNGVSTTDVISGGLTHFVFDHHTVEKDEEGNDARKRYPSDVEGQPGILYSAASHFFEWVTSSGISGMMPGTFMSEEKKAIIIDRLLKPVACQDNGQELNDYGMKANPLSFVSYMNPVGTDADAAFMKCVEMAIEIYLSISEHADKAVKDKMELSARFTTIEENHLRYLEMDEYLDGWIGKAVEYNDGVPTLLCSVFKGKVKGWNLQMIPKANGSFEIWHKIPEFIKEGEGGCTFVHAARWLAAFNTKEEAIAAAKQIVEFFS